MNLQTYMHHLIVQLIIQTFALKQYEPIKLYRFLLSFLFQAKYLVWASLAHNFDFLSLSSKWLSRRICINIYVELMPSEDIQPQSSPKIEKMVFSRLGNYFGQYMHKLFFIVSGSPSAIFSISQKTLCSCVVLSPNLSLKSHLCEKAVFFLLQVGILLGPNSQIIQLQTKKFQSFAFGYYMNNIYENEENLSGSLPGLV